MKDLTIIFFPILSGGLFYLFFRIETLILFSWIDNIGLLEQIINIRESWIIKSVSIPSWVKHSLPGALWAFSFTYGMLTIWNFKITKGNAIWIIVAPLLAIIIEFGQFFGFIRGTFDFIDLILILIASAMPFLKLLNIKEVSYEKA